MKKYIDLLSASGADAWELTVTRTTGWEFYFIRHRLDQHRAKNVEYITLKVYKKSPDGQFWGSAAAKAMPDASEEELKKMVKDLVFQASLVKNRPYRLNPPRPYEPAVSDMRPLDEEARLFIRTMEALPETETEYLNSFEIFTSRVERRLINSEGIDLTETTPFSMLDVVVNAKDQEREIELYRLLKMGGCQEDQLKRNIEELLTFGRDRLTAQPTPAGLQVPVILSTDAALSIYEYFLDQMNAAYQVRGISRLKVGEPMAEKILGDTITLEALRTLPGSPVNYACDPEGAPIRDLVLIADSVPENCIGSRMFSQYMGLEDAFIVSNWRVAGGKQSAGDLRSGAFLEIVEFSDFQVDAMTGDLFGEIRLGYYHDGEGKCTVVTGGSVSGNMADNLPEMYLSEETRQYSHAVIPEATKLMHVTIAGVH